MSGFLSVYVYVFGVRFHLYTSLLIALTATVGWFLLLRVKPLGRVVSVVALCAFVVHLYEVFHASGEYLFMGYTGLSVLTINLPSVVLATLILRHFAGVRPHPVVVFSAVLGLGVAIGIMGYQGFYSTLDYSPAWAFSKVMASIVGLAVVRSYQ